MGIQRAAERIRQENLQLIQKQVKLTFVSCQHSPLGIKLPPDHFLNKVQISNIEYKELKVYV